MTGYLLMGLTAVFTGLTVLFLYLNWRSGRPSLVVVPRDLDIPTVLVRITSRDVRTVRNIVLERKENKKWIRTPFKYYAFPLNGIYRKITNTTTDQVSDHDVEMPPEEFPDGLYRITVSLDRGKRSYCFKTCDGRLVVE
ncbi:hypothetical protein ACFL5M_05855 [Candidatus Neomarinimicrobiota bacterium]